MPLYVIERSFADRLELTSDDVRLIDDINADEGVSWLFSFISADKLRTYCLYEAPSPDAILEAARRANVPADEIVEVSKFVPGEMLAAEPSGACSPSRNPRERIPAA
jgi:hypothetical protein